MTSASSQPIRLLFLTLVVALCLAPSARAENLADGQIHKGVVVGTAPNQATVNVKFDAATGKSYIVVKNGPLKLFSNGVEIASIPTGGSFAIEGFSGLSSTANGLDLGDPKKYINTGSSYLFAFRLSLAPTSASFSFTPPTVDGVTARPLNAFAGGAGVTIKGKGVHRGIDSNWFHQNYTTGTDRDQLSSVGN